MYKSAFFRHQEVSVDLFLKVVLSSFNLGFECFRFFLKPYNFQPFIAFLQVTTFNNLIFIALLELWF